MKEENGQLTGMFLNRGGSPVKLASIEVKGDELVFQTAGNNNAPGQTHTARFANGQCVEVQWRLPKPKEVTADER